MSETELQGRLADIHRRLQRIERAANNKGHTFIILALLVLLMRGC